MRFNAHAKGGIKNLKGTIELELNFSARRPIRGRLADVGAETVQHPATSWRTCGPRRKGTLRLGATLLVSVHTGRADHDQPSPFCHYSFGACRDPRATP